MKIVNHRLDVARQCPSPNCSPRDSESDISLLVIHNISLPPDEFGGPYIDDLFCNALDADCHPFFREIVDLRVSAHLLIRRDGSLVQYVPFNMKAWHAGKSLFQGRDQCNDFSIGIELEGTDFVPFEDEQYARLGAVSELLIRTYSGLNAHRIVGHSDIAPGRKTDPGPFSEWQRYLSGLAHS